MISRVTRRVSTTTDTSRGQSRKCTDPRLPISLISRSYLNIRWVHLTSRTGLLTEVPGQDLQSPTFLNEAPPFTGIIQDTVLTQIRTVTARPICIPMGLICIMAPTLDTEGLTGRMAVHQCTINTKAGEEGIPFEVKTEELGW